MKAINNYLKLLSLATVFLLMSSCGKDYLDINTDPNSPSQVMANQILPAAEVNIGFVMGNELQRISAAVIQHYAGAGNQLLNYDQYDIQGTSVDGTWNGIYSGILQDLNQIEQLSATNGNNAYLGIARLLKAYITSVATDAFGDIPYSEALQDIRNTAPIFDSQQSIYNNLFTLIDQGLANLDAAPGVNPGAADLIYKGNLGLWKKMGNTLKLKLLLQIRKRDAARSAAGINALVAGKNLITSQSENFQLTFLTNTDRQHPMYDFAYNGRGGDIVMSNRFLDSMRTLNDPRIPFYFSNNNQFTSPTSGIPLYRGYDNGGQGTIPTESQRARLGVYTVGQSGEAPQRLLTNFQTFFMLAEASLTLNTTGNARDHFRSAVRTSLENVGVAPADTGAYIVQRLSAYDMATSTEAKLNVVMRDKWVAMFGMSFESWIDWRRTNYPRLAPASISKSPNGLIPRRLPYSATELISNKKAPRTQSSISAPVWWDVN